MHELVLRLPGALVEPVSESLVDVRDALAVSVEDANADTEREQPLFGEPGEVPTEPAWMHSTIKALFEDARAAESAAAWLLARPGHEGLRILAIAEVPDEDWVRRSQSQFEPVGIAPGFWVVPSWREVPPGATHVIRLDPGLAFGTGTHPTTRMCLRWIAAQALREAAPRRVLDYGCGSGILAIAAALHGAQAVDAVDIDPSAVQATRLNAAANAVEVETGLPERASGEYKWVLANILATPLELLAPLLSAHVEPGGHLLLAGLLTRQAERMVQVYSPWISMHAADEEQGWVLLVGHRSPDIPMA